MLRLQELLTHGNNDTRQIAASVVRNVAVRGDVRSSFATAGTIERLVEVLETGTPEAQESAAGAIANLTFGHETNTLRAVSVGAVAPLLKLMEYGSPAAKEVAAAALQKLATVSPDSKEAMVRALPMLLTTIKEGSEHAAERMAGALGNILNDEEVAVAAVDAGAIAVLVDVLFERGPAAKQAAANALAGIAEVGEAYEAAVGGGGAILPLVRLLQSGHRGGQEGAASAICSMCQTCTNNKDAFGNTKAIPTLVSLLQPDEERHDETNLEIAAAAALANLALCHPLNALRIARAGALQPLVALLVVARAELLEDIAQALASITASVEGLHGRRFSSDLIKLGAVPLLQQLLQNGTPGGRAAAAAVLQNLSAATPSETEVFLTSGLLSELMQQLEGEAEVRESSSGTLRNLSVGNSNAVAAIMARKGACELLIEAVKEGTVEGRANAAAVLQNIAFDSTEHGIHLKELGAIPPLAELLREGEKCGKHAAAGALHNLAFDREQNLMVIAEALNLKVTAPYFQVIEELRRLKDVVCDVSSDSEHDSDSD